MEDLSCSEVRPVRHRLKRSFDTDPVRFELALPRSDVDLEELNSSLDFFVVSLTLGRKKAKSDSANDQSMSRRKVYCSCLGIR